MTTKTAYLGARIYHDGILIEDHALLAENGKTLAILAAGDIPADATVHHLDGGILTPGFIETQANGGGGYLVNDRFDADGLAHILAAHRQYGTVAMLPTFITDAQDNYHRAIASIAEASRTVPGILGGHFEGPFLSPEKKGTHNPAYLRTPDESDFACFAAHADALQYSIISLAPERVPAGTVRRIREMGIRVFVKEDRLVNEHGSLAGAHVTLLQCVKNAIRYMHIAVEDALAMAITNPARYLDRPDLARITARRLDDILWLSDDLALQTLP